MTRIARITTHFVETNVSLEGETRFVDYNVELRQGSKRWTIGRVSGATSKRYSNSWMGLPIGATAWTCRHTTRKAALAALLAREDWQIVRSDADMAAAA